MLLPVVFATAIGSPVSGRLLDKYGSRILILAALISASAGFILLSSASGSKYTFYFGGILLGFGFSVLSGSALRYIMLNEVQVSERASTQGVVTIFVSIGQMVGAAFIGTIVASNAVTLIGYRQVFLIIAVFSIVLAIMGLFLKSRKKELLTIAKSAQ